MGRVMSVFEAEVGSLHGTLFALCTTLDFSSSLTTAYIGWRRRRGGGVVLVNEFGSRRISSYLRHHFHLTKNGFDVQQAWVGL